MIFFMSNCEQDWTLSESKIVNSTVMYFKISSVGDRILLISSTTKEYVEEKSLVVQ
jgi:hypothetical protein